MILYLGADHAGYTKKEKIKKLLAQEGFQIEDLGATSVDREDDFNDYASVVAQEVAKEESNRGILFCGSGEGMAMAANRHQGIRAAIVWNTKVAQQAKIHNDANILAIPSDYLDTQTAFDIIMAWLNEDFSQDPKYSRRNQKLDNI